MGVNVCNYACAPCWPSSTRRQTPNAKHQTRPRAPVVSAPTSAAASASVLIVPVSIRRARTRRISRRCDACAHPPIDTALAGGITTSALARGHAARPQGDGPGLPVPTSMGNRGCRSRVPLAVSGGGIGTVAGAVAAACGRLHEACVPQVMNESRMRVHDISVQSSLNGRE
ncbi:hypothetical protein DENSPDRAFT_55904 [Dentipellis sp. KUC8613]|nr:hypothetical protein DENSPDRAFT_55904 [Dentipellis sp. KUC8613]